MPERPLQATLHEVRPCVTCRHHHQHDHAKLVYNFRAETIPKPSGIFALIIQLLHHQQRHHHLHWDLRLLLGVASHYLDVESYQIVLN